MDETKAAAQKLREAFSELNFPNAFMENYDMLECLSTDRGMETFLVRKKDTGVFYVARCYDRSIYDTVIEADILKVLHHPQLPVYEGEFHNETMSCHLRQYIAGISLEAFLQENQLSREEITAISVSLCDILDYLHKQTPPVIHRDIKPRNIIIREDGLPVLIDFDIARVYKNDSDLDTVFKGTQVYAPPEQYGFSQTDARSDIYSFGITLRYMLTGSPRENPNVRLYAPLEKIIQKCTAFSPKSRYRDICEVKKALLRANPKSRLMRGIKIGLCIAVACAVLSFAGWKVYEYVTFDPYADGHIPSVLQDEERMLDACSYLEEKYGTHLFDNIHDYATIGLMKEALVEIYGMDYNYAWIGYAGEPPEESEEHFFPWPIGNEQYPGKLEVCYFVTKIYWPEKVADWSSLRDDNGMYPGSRVAQAWCEKTGITIGVNRPTDSSVGELAIALANADRVYTALAEAE